MLRRPVPAALPSSSPSLSFSRSLETLVGVGEGGSKSGLACPGTCFAGLLDKFMRLRSDLAPERVTGQRLRFVCCCLSQSPVPCPSSLSLSQYLSLPLRLCLCRCLCVCVAFINPLRVSPICVCVCEFV